MTHDINTCRSYSTHANLEKALAKLGFDKDRHVVVCNEAGRYTAIFPVSNLTAKGGYLGVYAVRGFLTLG